MLRKTLVRRAGTGDYPSSNRFLKICFVVVTLLFCSIDFVRAGELVNEPGPQAAASAQQWHQVSSRSGHFTVEMPGEVRKSKHESDIHQSTSYFASIQDGKPTDFILSCTKHDSGYLTRRSQDKLLKDAMELNVSLVLGKIVKHRYVTWQGNQSVEFEFVGYSRSKKHSPEGRNYDLHGKGRIILAGGLEYALICTTMKPAVGAACDKFLRSFTLASG